MAEAQRQAENVEVARRSLELFSAEGVEAARPMWADDVVWHDPPGFPDLKRAEARRAAGL